VRDTEGSRHRQFRRPVEDRSGDRSGFEAHSRIVANAENKINIASGK
jgi:hypothetical protein